MKRCPGCKTLLHSKRKRCSACGSLFMRSPIFRGVRPKELKLRDGTPTGVNRWQAFVYHDKVNEYLGTFHKAEEAALAHDRRARQLFGSGAVTNFTTEEEALEAARSSRIPEGASEIYPRQRGGGGGVVRAYAC